MPHYNVRGKAPDAAPAGFVPNAATAPRSAPADGGSGGTRAQRRAAGKRLAAAGQRADEPAAAAAAVAAAAAADPAPKAARPAARPRTAAPAAATETPAASDAPGKKTKKEKKRERQAAEMAAAGPGKRERGPETEEEQELKRARADVVAAGRRVFVGHVQQSATEAELRAVLEPCGPISAVDMMLRKDTNRFKGSAFVDFAAAAAAAAAVERNGALALRGKILVIELAKADDDKEEKPAAGGGDAGTAAAEPGPSCFVSNLPLGVHRPVVREAFSVFGEVKRVKILDALPDCARAFVDFHHTDCAAKAVATSGQVLLGRRLAIGFSAKQTPAPAPAAAEAQAKAKAAKHAGGAHRAMCRCPKCLSGSGATTGFNPTGSSW